MSSRGISYSPVPETSLSGKQQDSLARFLKSTTSYLTYSSTLGWTLRQNRQTSLYQSNAQGIRAQKEYQSTSQTDSVRIASFGDSYTHCNDVANEQSWQEYLHRVSSNLEVMNFGVPAYGLDQALLRYQQDGVQYHPHIVFIGFMSENIARNVNVFRPFYYPPTPVPLAKPRFLMQNDRLSLYENPIRNISQYRDVLEQPQRMLPTLGRNDYYYQHGYKRGIFDVLPSVRLVKMMNYKLRYRLMSGGSYREDTEAFKVTVKLFDLFYSSVVDHDSVPLILVFPERADFTSSMEKKKRYTPLLKYFDMKGYDYIDLSDAFDGRNETFTQDEIFTKGNHYSPLGNEFVAKYIWGYLQEHNLTDRKAILRK